MQIYYFFFIHANLSPIFSKKSHKVPFLTRFFLLNGYACPLLWHTTKIMPPPPSIAKNPADVVSFGGAAFFFFISPNQALAIKSAVNEIAVKTIWWSIHCFLFRCVKGVGESSGGCYPGWDAASEYGLNVAGCDYSALPSLPSTSLILWI